MKVWLKVQNIHGENRSETIVGICDQELLGKKVGCLNISESFFKGELIEIDDALQKIETATMTNLVGKNITSAALEKGIISKKGIKEIEKIPQAQIFIIG